jgi:hypothetical protein
VRRKQSPLADDARCGAGGQQEADIIDVKGVDLDRWIDDFLVVYTVRIDNRCFVGFAIGHSKKYSDQGVRCPIQKSRWQPVVLRELSPILGDGLMDQAAAIWD